MTIPGDSLLMDKYQLRQYGSTRYIAQRTGASSHDKPSGIILFGNPRFSMSRTEIMKQGSGKQQKNVSTTLYAPPTRRKGDNLWDNLPSSEKEITGIEKMFSQNKIVASFYLQTAASEENLKALSGKAPKVLHISTHGFFFAPPAADKEKKKPEEKNQYRLANNPLLRSGLVLAGANYVWSGKLPEEGVEDGIATAYEISQLDFSNTELVVLSACETGLGDVRGSEGLFGLQRGFKMAGVKKMIVSLWRVPDEDTWKLMNAFYSYWFKGVSIEDAFYHAQNDMRKKYPPYHWASFVLIE
jgi:CHAT domain-containing protein